MTTLNELDALFVGKHMTPQIDECDYWAVETDNGIWYVPCDVVGDGAKVGLRYEAGDSDDADEVLSMFRQFVGGEPTEAEVAHGWLARLSAPGYMDCTDWCGFDNEQDAIEYLADMADED